MNNYHTDTDALGSQLYQQVQRFKLERPNSHTFASSWENLYGWEHAKWQEIAMTLYKLDRPTVDCKSSPMFVALKIKYDIPLTKEDHDMIKYFNGQVDAAYGLLDKGPRYQYMYDSSGELKRTIVKEAETITLGDLL